MEKRQEKWETGELRNNLGKLGVKDFKTSQTEGAVFEGNVVLRGRVEQAGVCNSKRQIMKPIISFN